ncbi:DUF1656 domain-containing protein [Chelatococcus sp. YT9]|uniref:DUF1656 domain-containing protein n=1 Tax=Chelatococcus sp. YT9 TaxID=2835635 RepID=UPI001BCFDE42|nr:DUF1656 domain-containing protein [Chelatococcus sp. YT9]MBS7701453.1 DUF1656 domain-containing protein [Chelatococcus sp. YT9]
MGQPNLTVFHTMELLGFYLPPLAFWATAAIVPFVILRWAFGKIGFYRFVWHRPLFNIALYVLVTGGVVGLGNLAWL